MATKAKSAATPKPAPPPSQPSPHAATYAKGVKLLDSGKHAEALKVLQPLIHEAEASGEWALKRRVEIYVALAQANIDPPKAVHADPLSEAQALLNRREGEAAIKLLDKLIKANPAKGTYHYLRSLAFAQAENAEGAAESMKKAMDLDPDLVYLWHMEPDFNSMRKSPLFGFTEGR